MKSRIRLLNLVVFFTLILLTIGATLVVLGIFNEALNWDIFGPKLEAILYGLFGSCMALSGFGVAMTVILALQESVKDFKKFVRVRTKDAEIPDASTQTYATRMMTVVAIMVVLVVICAGINHLVLTQRCAVFKRLASEQVGRFEKHLVTLVEPFSVPPSHAVPHDLYDVIKTLDNLEFVIRTTIYLPDPDEPTAMWGYTAWRNVYSNADGFARFYVAKDFERAMRSAVDGNPAPLEEINDRNEFIWYKLLKTSDGDDKAIVRIDGNSHQSFREYKLGQ